MAKIFVTAVVEWITGQPGILVSVESQTGQPLTDLKAKDFSAAVIGSGGAWNKTQIQQINSTGASHGFYGLFVKPPTPFSGWQSWMSNFVFAIEVEHGSDRGQCLTINKCCGDDGMGNRSQR